MTSPASGASSAADLPDYAPIPRPALGPALNEQGYYVGRVERNLYWVTDGVYQSAFLTTDDGVVLFDAPPTIGGNLRRAVDEIAAANGVTNRVTHLVYSHHHADHAGAASLFGGDVTRVGHEETRRLLLRDNDPDRPVPEITFADRYTLQVGGERAELAWHGPNHTPDNIYIHFPGHDTLMFIDVVNAGWVLIYNLNLSEDVIGYMGAPAIALSYPWTHFISGHLGRLATHDDVAIHQQYIADIEASAREALTSIDPVPFYVAGGQNVWAGAKPTSTPSPNARPPPSSRSTPACWPPRTSRFSPGPPRSRSCSRCASTTGSPSAARRSTPDQRTRGLTKSRPRVRVWLTSSPRPTRRPDHRHRRLSGYEGGTHRCNRIHRVPRTDRTARPRPRGDRARPR